MNKGFFITLEGVDGCGKTTQAKLLQDYFKSKNIEVLVLREPGGTAIGEKIRTIILDVKNAEMSNITEMLLYASARAQLVSEVIKPALLAGKIVICDRFIDSSFVYQGFARGIDLDIVYKVNNIVLNETIPDITLFLDISPEITLKRRRFQNTSDRIEKENIEFHLMVYSGYKKIASMYPDRIKTINCNDSIESIFNNIRKHLQNILN